MMNSAGFAVHQSLRTFRLCIKSSTDNPELRRHISIQPYLRTRSFSDFSFTSVVKRFSKCKSLQTFKNEMNEKLVVLGEILTEQFNFYTSQRIRRMSQVWNLYTRLYTETTFRNIVYQMVKSLRNQQKKPINLLLGVALFSWEKEKITYKELQSSIFELDNFDRSSTISPTATINESGFTEKLKEEGWEAVIQKDRCQLWRKAFPNTYLYEYKIFGTFYDVPAKAFFSVQTDIEYRKTWDKLVIKLDVIDKEDNCEVVHWVMHYPYPMYSREYVYIRRTLVDPITNTMVLVSRAVDHPSCPANKKYVRVSKYASQMVIRPHGNFEENGFDYILTYFDDPQAAFPSAAYNWMASSGVPDFVEKLHDAARELHFMQRRNKSSHTQVLTPNSHLPAGEMEYAYM